MSAVPHSQGKPKLSDVRKLRESARRDIEEGAVTHDYRADREKVLQMLNEALATEIVCVLRYRHDHFVARGLKAKVVADELLEHATRNIGSARTCGRSSARTWSRSGSRSTAIARWCGSWATTIPPRAA